MSKESLYNLYRPTSFDEVEGQDHIIKIIKEQIRTDSLPHSLIFYGPKGVGKTSVARIVAKRYNENSAGVKEIDAAHDRRVETIRQLIPSLDYQVLQGNFLTVIFDEAHQMTNDAFQALQKVVEEPPEDVRFIFVTTRIEKIPTTIIDRSQRHHFNRIKPGVIMKRLREVSSKEFESRIPDEMLGYAVKMADGSLRGALVALGEIVSFVNTGITEKEVADILGVLGDPRIAHFIKSYLSEIVKPSPNLNMLLSCIQMFESDKIDAVIAFSDFQQFLIDCIYYVKDQSCVEYLKSDVSFLFKEIDSNISAQWFEKELWKMYKLSLTYERHLNPDANNSKIFRGYLLELITSAS